MLNKHDFSKNISNNITKQSLGFGKYPDIQNRFGLTGAKSAAIVVLYKEFGLNCDLNLSELKNRLEELLVHFNSITESTMSPFDIFLIRHEQQYENIIDPLLEFINTLECDLGMDAADIPIILSFLTQNTEG